MSWLSGLCLAIAAIAAEEAAESVRLMQAMP